MLADCAELGMETRSMLGADQERWLAQGLADSRRRWKLIGQASQISASGVETPVGRRIYTDGWDGYPRARERLLEAVQRARAGNVVCLGGDVHRHVAAHLRERPDDPRSRIVASEFVCSSITSRGVSEAVMEMMRRANPDLVHARSDERGYALIDVTAGSADCEFRATPFPARPGERLSTQARVSVESGRPGVALA